MKKMLVVLFPNIQASLDAIKKQMGEQVNAEAAAKLQAMIDQNKANAAALTAPASGQPTPAALAAAASSLAATQPAQVEKQIKELPPLAVEYNGKVYAKNGTTIKMQPGNLDGVLQPNGDIELICGFFLKNNPDSQPIGWKLQTASGTELPLVEPLRVSLSNTDVYLGIKWPDGQSSLKLTATSGSRSISLNLTKPDWYVKDLKVSERSPTSKQVRTAIAGQTLYLVQDNSNNSLRLTSSRTPTYSYRTNLDDIVLKKYLTHHNYGENTSRTLESGVAPINHQILYSYDKVPASHGLNVKALGYDKTVKVQLVPFDKREDEAVIPGALFTKVKKLQVAIKDINIIKNKIDNALGEKASLSKDGEAGLSVVANGQRYNEEDSKTNNYNSVKEYEIKFVGSLAYTFRYGPTKFIPHALKDYIDISIYAKPSLDAELIKNEKWERLNSVGVEKLNKGDSYNKFQIVGGVALGANVKINASRAFKFELDASGKSEIEGSLSLRMPPNIRWVVTAKPLVFNFSAFVSIVDIEVLKYNYIKNITNEYTIYDSDN